MDLGCLDMGCISVSDKHSNETFTDSSSKESDINDPVSANSRTGKSKSPKGNQPTWNVLNKCTTQIKKPRHRNSSPLNWFPRKKVDSYLKRKIKMLQEVDGMNLTLDETLGDTNPHYSRVLREKMAAREAAHKAMEAWKAALVEASWSRILKAARIQSKEAEALLLKSEKAAAEAFEAATAMGVIMHDKPNCPQTHFQIETSSVNGGGFTTHTITASFDTAFEVDKEVAAAVKTAFVRLANYPPFSKDEFKDLLHKISENPDTGDCNQELLEYSSECESESGSEFEIMSGKNGFSTQDLDAKKAVLGMRQRKSKRRQSPEKVNRANLIEMMLERLKCLQEDELSSLATIVATRGLSAVLAEVEHNKSHYPSSAIDLPATSVPNSRRMSSLGAGTMRNANLECFMNGSIRRKQTELELPSLDKFLVKHITKLEREVQEAKNSRIKDSKEITGEDPVETEDGEVKVDRENVQSETTSDLGSDLLKHSSKFAKEIEAAKKNSGNNFKIVCKDAEEAGGASEEEFSQRKKDVPEIPSLDKFLVKHVSRLEKEVQEAKSEAKSRRNNDSIDEAKKAAADSVEVPSLDKFLVKHVSRLEKEVQEAKSRRDNDPIEGSSRSMDLKKHIESQSENNGVVKGKENIDLNKEEDGRFSQIEEREMKARTEHTVDSLDKILVKPVHRLEREKMQATSSGNNYRNQRPQKNQGWNNDTECDGLDKVLVKHVSRLEKEKLKFNASEEAVKVVKRNGINAHSQSRMIEEGSLDQVLVKHKSRLEREKMAAAARQPEEEHTRHSVTRREGRERELQEAWGGISLGSIHSQSRMNEEGSLDQVLVKHKSRLEREKMAAAARQPEEEHIRHSLARREARERELQEAWGGISLGNSIKPHLSKLERDKAAWIKAEEEERRQAMEGM